MSYACLKATYWVSRFVQYDTPILGVLKLGVALVDEIRIVGVVVDVAAGGIVFLSGPHQCLLRRSGLR